MSGCDVVVAALQRPGTRADVFERCRSIQPDSTTLASLKRLLARGLVVRRGSHRRGVYRATVDAMPERGERPHVAWRAERIAPRNRGLLDALPVRPLPPARTAVVPVSSSWLIGAP